MKLYTDLIVDIVFTAIVYVVCSIGFIVIIGILAGALYTR